MPRPRVFWRCPGPPWERRAPFAAKCHNNFALLANAAFCGVISNPHDRYGSRMVWIAAFAVALAAWRAFVVARERSGWLRPIAAGGRGSVSAA